MSARVSDRVSVRARVPKIVSVSARFQEKISKNARVPERVLVSARIPEKKIRECQNEPVFFYSSFLETLQVTVTLTFFANFNRLQATDLSKTAHQKLVHLFVWKFVHRHTHTHIHTDRKTEVKI